VPQFLGAVMNRISGFFLFLLILASSTEQAWPRVFSETGHGNPLTGAMRDLAFPRGSCRQCHVSGPARYPKELWRENDNEICFTCHPAANFSGLYPGREIFEVSTHKTDPRFVWPGPFPPARRGVDMAGKCINCHNPHGRKDRADRIPNLLIAPEVNLCLSCHDGSHALKDIAREMRKPYSHRGLPGALVTRQEGNPDRYSYLGGNRHVVCSDCHNAHAVTGDAAPPYAPAASGRNAMVSRIRVTNSGPGTVPRYEYLSASDTSTPLLEYQICYKCHSSWTRQPPGQQDIALLLNPNNASFHPVEAPGKNTGIAAGSFVGSLNSYSTVHCSDCHGSDDAADLRGPHGSRFPNLLKGAYETQSHSRISNREDLCFRCHSFATYADPFSAPYQQEDSRFGKHVLHVGQQNIPCYACHESHGSPQFGSLIVTGRNPGLRNFSMTANGGSCLPTCHDSRFYSVNYSR
jgi:predicted CXXCH cytochrome family protein